MPSRVTCLRQTRAAATVAWAEARRAQRLFTLYTHRGGRMHAGRPLGDERDSQCWFISRGWRRTGRKADRRAWDVDILVINDMCCEEAGHDASGHAGRLGEGARRELRHTSCRVGRVGRGHVCEAFPAILEAGAESWPEATPAMSMPGAPCDTKVGVCLFRQRLSFAHAVVASATMAPTWQACGDTKQR